jgi:hypothetical protein
MIHAHAFVGCITAPSTSTSINISILVYVRSAAVVTAWLPPLVQKRHAEPSQAVKLAQLVLVARAAARVPFSEGRASAVRRQLLTSADRH